MQLFTLGIPVRICHGFCLHHNQNHINQNWILGVGLCLNYLVISRFVEMVTVTLGYNNNSEIMDHKVSVWPYDRIILLQFTFAKDKLATISCIPIREKIRSDSTHLHLRHLIPYFMPLKTWEAELPCFGVSVGGFVCHLDDLCRFSAITNHQVISILLTGRDVY